MTATGDRGAAGLMTLLIISLGLAASAVVLGIAADVALAAARARTAADAAALAAAATSPLVSDDPLSMGPGVAREAAAEVAQANGAQVETVDMAGWPLRVFVRVGVRPRTQIARTLVGTSKAGATAAVRPPSGGNPDQAALLWQRPPTMMGVFACPSSGALKRDAAAPTMRCSRAASPWVIPSPGALVRHKARGRTSSTL